MTTQITGNLCESLNACKTDRETHRYKQGHKNIRRLSIIADKDRDKGRRPMYKSES